MADYIVLTDVYFELAEGDLEKPLTVNLPEGTRFDAPAILAYVADPSTGADKLKYKVLYRYTWEGETTDDYEQWDINITDGLLIGGVKRGLFEVISGPRVLRSDEPPFQDVPKHNAPVGYGSLRQSVVFKVESGSGTVKFSDVVLWFQR